jgi:hypothetical protein
MGPVLFSGCAALGHVGPHTARHLVSTRLSC